MSKKVNVTPSELVLSAIYFLQQKNGVSERDITRFVCKKWGCKQSTVASEVKEALEKAIENGIFTKKRGLYRIESSAENDLKSGKKRAGQGRRKKDSFDFEQIHSSCKCLDNHDEPWLNSRSSNSDRMSLEKFDSVKDKDDEEEEDDYVDEEDDEDSFDDDQVDDSYELRNEYHSPVKTKPSKPRGRQASKSKNEGPSRTRRRKYSKPRRRYNRRKKLVCTCNDSDSPVKRSGRYANDGELQENASGKKNYESEECDRCAGNKRRNTRKVTKGGAEFSDDEYCRECNCNLMEEEKDDCESEDPKDGIDLIGSEEDQTAKCPTEEQPKRKMKDGVRNEGKELSKAGDDATSRKDPKERGPPNTVKSTATPNEVPPDREWRRKKAKRERSSSLFRPVKKQLSSKDKSSLEQKSAKHKTSK